MNHFVKLFCTTIIAAAILYFSYTLGALVSEIKQIREQLPNVISDVERIEKQINVEEWIKLVSLLEKQVPEILKQSERIRETVSDVNTNIPFVLTEIKSLREQTIPSVIKRVDTITNTSLPALLDETNSLQSQTIPAILAESKILRTQTIPPVLNEAQQIRIMVPPTLVKVESLVKEAQNAADQASQGAVKGTVKGILTTPLDIIKEAGSAVLDLEEDVKKEN